MNRLLLRYFNGPALFVITLIAIAIQSSLFNAYPFMYLQPDIVLLVVIWAALKRGFEEGGVITFLVAYVAEIHSSATQGLFLITYMGAFLTIRGLNKYFVFSKASAMVGLTMIMSLAMKLMGLLVLGLMGLAENQWRQVMALLLPTAVMEGVAGIWVFRWFDRFDWLTYKDERARKALDDELRMEEEGL